MCELLGSRDCIESLHKDLVDLEGAILEVFSRTGPVRFPSRKFPDQLSCHLDMLSLLEQHDFIEGEDAYNQRSQVNLQELLVDRLMLLLQSFNSYIVQLMSRSGKDQTLQKGCQSVGLVANSYWANLVEFAKMKESCRDTAKTAIQSCVSRNNLSACSSKSTISSQIHIPPRPTHISSQHKGCQTIQSSLTPCDACHEVQSLLRKTGESLVDLLNTEGLPSSLQSLMLAVDDTMEMGDMTASDVAQWGIEQLRDIRRLSKHLEEVRGTVQPLKERLAAAETERDRFKSQLAKSQEEFKLKLDQHQANSVQLEFSLNKTERAMKETEIRLEEQQQRLQRQIMTLEDTNSRFKEKVASQQNTLQALECDKSVLCEKVKSLQIEKEEECRKLQQTIQQLQRQTSEIQLLLDNESAKHQRACREQESMRAKQRSLEKTVSILEEDCEDLQKELQEIKELEFYQLQQLSDEKEELETQLTQQKDLCLETAGKKRILEGHVKELKNRVAKLKEHIQSLKEREKVLVAFPELTPLSAQPQTTGSVYLDMKRQLQANSIRIEVLEKENAVLVQSILKLEEKDQLDATKEHVPKQAWDASPSTPSEEEQQQHPQTLKQRSPLQSSGVAQMECSGKGKQTCGRKMGLKPERPRALVSSSHQALQINLQPRHLSTKSTAVPRNRNKKSIFLHPDCRAVNNKRK